METPGEIHMQYFMLFEFHKASNATVSIKNIYDVYPTALEIPNCQRQYFKLRLCNFVLSNSYQSKR